MKWNEIPFDENANPETKALEFDLQLAENARLAAEAETARIAIITAEQARIAAQKGGGK
jgi:hypothetical protein